METDLATEKLMREVRALPAAPGVYLMRDAGGHLLYVGKAARLRDRVRSYFKPPAASAKNSILVQFVRHIDFIPCRKPSEALLLEQKLIRRFQPKYNVMWRDDKRYPMLKLTTAEDFPRLVLVRKREGPGKYFGPYPDASSLRKTLRMIGRIFPLRRCRLPIREGVVTEEGRRKARACLYYHIGRCSAPCLGDISRKNYALIVREVEMFLTGRNGELLGRLRAKMDRAAREMEFERAARLRDEIAAVETTVRSVRLRKIREEDALAECAPWALSDALARALELPKPPDRIEGYDISNLGDRDACGSLAAFENGRPCRDRYRRFKIRRVAGQNDFAMISEVLRRRFSGSLRSGQNPLPDPDLILIDGGKGQLAAAREALRSLGIQTIPAVALAKQNEEIFRPGFDDPLRLPPDSPALRLLQQVRDEAHRFAVSYHRLLRKKHAGLVG